MTSKVFEFTQKNVRSVDCMINWYFNQNSKYFSKLYLKKSKFSLFWFVSMQNNLSEATSDLLKKKWIKVNYKIVAVTTTTGNNNVPYYYYGNGNYGGNGNNPYQYYNQRAPTTGRKPGRKRFSQMRRKPSNAMQRRRIWNRRRRPAVGGQVGVNRNKQQQILGGGILGGGANRGRPPRGNQRWRHRNHRSTEKRTILGSIVKALQIVFSKSIYLLGRTVKSWSKQQIKWNVKYTFFLTAAKYKQ